MNSLLFHLIITRVAPVLQKHFLLYCINPLSANPQNGQTTQTIRWQQPKNCLRVFDHFVGLALKGLIFVHSVFEKLSYRTLVNYAKKLLQYPDAKNRKNEECS